MITIITEYGTFLVIKSVDANSANTTTINNVNNLSKLARLLEEFPNIGSVDSSGYSKFAPTHGVKHFIETNDARPMFGAKKKAVEQEFKAMLAASIV